jgi:hypothetical protein
MKFLLLINVLIFSKVKKCFVMAKNIKYYGGERIVSLQKEKILEISKIFSNPFWKDVFYSLYLKNNLFRSLNSDCFKFDSEVSK